jgi:hypothetical protein
MSVYGQQPLALRLPFLIAPESCILRMWRLARGEPLPHMMDSHLKRLLSYDWSPYEKGSTFHTSSFGFAPTLDLTRRREGTRPPLPPGPTRDYDEAVQPTK